MNANKRVLLKILEPLNSIKRLEKHAKVFEDHPRPSSVMEPKEIDFLCELVGHPAMVGHPAAAPPMEDLLY